MPTDPLDLPAYTSFEGMSDCPKWRAALASLNAHLAAALVAENAEVSLNGNLFYAHKDLEFQEKPLLEDYEGKRRNLFKLAQGSGKFLEVGVNGGHSLFLALSANPNLHCIGIDICAQVSPTWARVDIYVPAAFEWLAAAFPGRTAFITGNSLVELPRFVLDNPDEKIDLLHLDGAKDTHLREFLAAQPVLTRGAHVIVDDTNTRPVKQSMRQMLQLKLAQHADANVLGLETTFGHRILSVI